MTDLTPTRLRTLLAAFPPLRIGVIGDFFLDAYYDCDPALDEKSLETGRTCYQVVGHRRQAGAAGTVAANLRALGVGKVAAIGYCGDDGEGYELRRAMRGLGLDLADFVTAPNRFTPTYGKPCYIDGTRRGRPAVEELERLDSKNRHTTPASLQDELIDRIRAGLDRWDAVVLGGALRGFVTNALVAAETPGLTLDLIDDDDEVRAPYDAADPSPVDETEPDQTDDDDAEDKPTAARPTKRLFARPSRDRIETIGKRGGEIGRKQSISRTRVGKGRRERRRFRDVCDGHQGKREDDPGVSIEDF